MRKKRTVELDQRTWKVVKIDGVRRGLTINEYLEKAALQMYAKSLSRKK